MRLIADLPFGPLHLASAPLHACHPGRKPVARDTSYFHHGLPGGIYGFRAFNRTDYPSGVYMYKSGDGRVTREGQYLGNGSENAAAIDQDGTIHVVYSDHTSMEDFTLYYRRVENFGASWSEPVVLAEDHSGESGYNPPAWSSIASARKEACSAALVMVRAQIPAMEPRASVMAIPFRCAPS